MDTEKGFRLLKLLTEDLDKVSPLVALHRLGMIKSICERLEEVGAIELVQEDNKLIVRRIN